MNQNYKYIENIKKNKNLNELQVAEMANGYKELVFKDTSKRILQVNMDATKIMKICGNSEGIRLIFAVDLTVPEIPIVIVDLYNFATNSSKYYKLNDFFPDPENNTNMRKHGLLCPPPSPCEIVLKN